MKAGKLTVVIGASRSGKSAFMQEKLKSYKNVLVWDIKGEYGDVQYQPRLAADLIRCIQQKGDAVIGYVPPGLGSFDFFCRTAQVWIKNCALRGESCALVIEETSDVTSAGKAPDSYGILLRRFLAYGVDIYSVCQRTAESDKTSIGNASQMHICRLTLPNDRKTAALSSGVPLAVIESLRADQDAGRFDFVSVDLGRGEYRRGVLTWPGGKSHWEMLGEVEKI